MAGSAGLVATEIRSIRRGRGVYAPDLDQRLGPHLRDLARGGGMGEDDGDAATVRSVLIAELCTHADRLAGDLRVAVMAGLGLSAETRQMPYFKDRVSWLAGQVGRDYRTAIRRVDAAEQLLAEEIAHELRRRRGGYPGAPTGWHLDELRTLLRLDTPTPESHEHRRIVAARDGLTEIMAWLDVPSNLDGHEPNLSVEVLYGASLVRREQPTRHRFQFVIRLPAPLKRGERHEYGLLLRMPVNEPMRPHYVLTPECACAMFDLRIRFDQGRPPSWVRCVRGEPVRVFEAAEPGGEILDLDAAGEVHVQFRNPTMYLGYGAQWWP